MLVDQGLVNVQMFHIAQLILAFKISQHRTYKSPPPDVSISKKIPMTFPLTSIPTKINFPLYSIIMWLKQCHKPPMTGNGNHTTYKHGEIWDGLSLFCQHYYILLPSECTFMLGTFIMVAQYYLLISHVGKNIYTYI